VVRLGGLLPLFAYGPWEAGQPALSQLAVVADLRWRGKPASARMIMTPKITRVPLMVIGARVTNSSNLESLLIQTPVGAAAIFSSTVETHWVRHLLFCCGLSLITMSYGCRRSAAEARLIARV